VGGVLLLIAAVVGGWCAPGSASLRPPKPRAYVVGDSLLDEARAYVDFTGVAGSVKGTIGRAPCDFLKTLSGTTRQALLQKSKVVIIETAANSSSKCMLEPGSTKVYMPIGSPEWRAKYRADLDAIFDLSNIDHVPMVLLEPPPMDPSQPASNSRNDLIDTVFPLLRADIAARYPLVTISSAARDAVGGDTFMATMPCLPDETAAMGCSGGTITVRAPDGLHFCPTGLLNQRTPCGLPYDPGARRFGNAIETVLRSSL
jgi:hypothetical protein